MKINNTLLEPLGPPQIFDVGQKMLRRAIFIGIMVVLGGCVGATSSMRSAGHVVVPAGQLCYTLGQQEWSPTEAQVISCEAAVARALARTNRDLGGYYLRLAGVIREGRRHIVGMAAHKLTGSHYLEPPSENQISLPAFGGGAAFFRFDYDSDREKLVQIEFNALL